MTLPWPVIKELLVLRERLNELFDRAVLQDGPAVGELSSGPICPAADLYETDHEVVVILEIADADFESIDLQRHGHRLRVSGQIGRRSASADGRYLQMERPRGAFFRDFKLPAVSFAGSPTAELERGVLTVRLPKAPESRRQKVEVRGDCA